MLSRHVLDLYSYMEAGSTEGLRRPNETPPAGHVEDPSVCMDRTLDDYLRRAREEVRTLRERGPDRSPIALLSRPTIFVRSNDLLYPFPPPGAVQQRVTNRDGAAMLPSGATPGYENPTGDPLAQDPLAEVGREVIAQQERDAGRRSDQLPAPSWA